MNKNWNDRADKDLFFTILSVKHIGVISGSEWTTIGNHMRSLGYGFTNEGCRQHFQGLRRAQQKAEQNHNANAPEPELAVDPSLEANARVAKRPRLDEHLDHSPQPSLDEDALLHTLAAHNQAEAEAQYEPEYYGEA
ncbi:hypothetical protein P8C59_007230 [Phyllachora maydis]|uniref:Myb-like domain-containing protein n=1 Tax=Phyllachora maydis TaxID=1825666 RepID=A0AAD9I7X8_9PEZI|nr:hypothetical protein P8C59_007230 [Phyllachora maydis]